MATTVSQDRGGPSTSRWAAGNVCHASVILITHDSIGEKFPSRRVGTILAKTGDSCPKLYGDVL